MTLAREEFEALRSIKHPGLYEHPIWTPRPDPKVLQRLWDEGMWETVKTGQEPDMDSPVIHGNFATRMKDIYGPRLTPAGEERFAWFEADSARWQTPEEYAKTYRVPMAQAMQTILAAGG
jgi:hypothetical protein